MTPAETAPVRAAGARVESRVAEPVRVRRLRICQVVPYDIAERGGVKHHAVQLARALRAAGDEVTLIGPAAAAYQEPHVVAFSGAANFPANGSDNRVGLLVAPWQVREFFRRQPFDVVHVHEPQVPLLPYWSVRYTPRSSHIATFHAYAEQPNPGFVRLSRLTGAWIAGAFQASTAVSEEAASYARLSWPQAMTIVPNGVPTDVFTPPSGARRPGPLRLLFVGRIGDARKGYDLLHGVFVRLRANGHECTLDVVGELGRAKPPAPVPGLTYHGPVPMQALIEHYRDCDVFIAPSTGQESFGIVLLEAMATARPVICSDIPGYRGAASLEGARLIPPNDAAALEKAIVDLAASPNRWPAMGAANRARACTFAWEALAQQVRGVYVNALEGDAGGENLRVGARPAAHAARSNAPL